MRLKIITIILLCSFTHTIFAQEVVIDIEPYTQDNIPTWAEDVRRFSIVSLGSVPFTVLASTLTYTTFRYAQNNFDSNYIPSPFPTSSTAANINKNEQIGILITGVSLGLIVGVVDLLVIKLQEQHEEESQLYEDGSEIIITNPQETILEIK